MMGHLHWSNKRPAKLNLTFRSNAGCGVWVRVPPSPLWTPLPVPNSCISSYDYSEIKVSFKNCEPWDKNHPSLLTHIFVLLHCFVPTVKGVSCICSFVHLPVSSTAERTSHTADQILTEDFLRTAVVWLLLMLRCPLGWPSGHCDRCSMVHNILTFTLCVWCCQGDDLIMWVYVTVINKRMLPLR